ncbi:MAG: DUF5996 family protein [Methyloceanibacter sp.]|nr:DUF5996 family protein [Methyloceanibacter sp.]
MDLEDSLRACAPSSLIEARAIAHKAVQLLAMVARANLKPEPDDSHSNLGWDVASKRFLTQPIAAGNNTLTIGLSLWPMHLDISRVNERAVTFDLDRRSFEDALHWLDGQLTQIGLEPASKVSLPYELPEAVARVERFLPHATSNQLSTLKTWFNLAQTVLSDFAKNHADLTPGPSPVRCWPHHFDIATYVQLEPSGSETTRGIGAGMSPGDDSYSQPYFYVNPWPHLAASDLPDAPHPGHWHTDGYVGAVATAEQILTLDDIPDSLLSFIESAFAVGRAQLDA